MLIALNQLTLTTNDLRASFAILEQTIQQNCTQGAKLCIFSEDFLYGVLREKEALMQAGQEFETNIQKVCGLAKKYKIDIIPGSLPRLYQGQVFNSTVYVDKTGKIRTLYSKHNLWLSERRDFAPSTEPLQVFQSVLGKTAIIICWDLTEPRLFEAAVRQSAEWIICLSFWMTSQTEDLKRIRGTVKTRYQGFSDPQFLDAMLPARCMEYNVGILFCNFSGVHTYMGEFNTIQKGISAGHTRVITPLKQIDQCLRSRKETTLYANIDLVKTRQLFKDMETWYGRREDILQRYPTKAPKS